MALTVSNVTTANSIASGATLDLTGVSAAVGEFLLLACAADNAGAAGVSSTSAAITDAAGNTWTRQSETNRTAGVANDGVTLAVWTAPVTNALSSATLTINFSPATTAKAAVLQKAVAAAGTVLSIMEVGAGASGSNAGHLVTAASVVAGCTILGWSAVETNVVPAVDADTAGGTWSTGYSATADTGVLATSVVILTQSKTPASTAAQSFNPSSGAARDWASNYIILNEQIAAALAATETPDLAALSAQALWTATLAATEAADVAVFGGDLYDPMDGSLAATEGSDRATFAGDVVDPAPEGEASSIRILVHIDWPDGPVTRLWDGGGPYVDPDGEIWTGAGNITTGLEELELALNGEASTLQLGITGVPSDAADMAWKDYTLDQVIGAVVGVLVQPCDELDQPVGDPSVHFIGDIDNMLFEDATDAGGVTSSVIIEVTNRFTMRRLAAGAVMSDTDQKARSAVINEGAPADRFAEFVPLMADKSVVWPRFTL